MASMHPPVQFRPTDEHLFAHYLERKARGAPLPPGLIEECDLYSQEPWKIFDTTSDQTFYVFTTLRKNKSRVLRTAGTGTWKEQHTMKIRGSRGELVGYRKSFKFQGRCGSSATRGRWIMYEFSLCDERQCKYVLCKIKYYGDEKKLEEKAIVISDDILAQIEDENQRAKRACLLNDYEHRTSVICDFALPSSTVDRAQPSASQAVSSNVAYAEPLHMSMGAVPALHFGTDDPAFPGYNGDAIADSHPPMVTATMQGSRDEWMQGWTTTGLEAVVHSGCNSMSSSLAPMEDDGSYTNLLACASSPPPETTTMTTTSEPDISDPTSPAFGSNATLNSLLPTVGTEASYASYSPSFGCNRDADMLPTIATSAQVDTSDTTHPAFDGGAYADSLPTVAEQVNDDEWIYRLMDMDIDPVVYSDCHFCSDVFANPSEDDTNAMLASTLGAPYNQTWDPSSLHQQRSVADSQEQVIPATLAWADPFLLVKENKQDKREGIEYERIERCFVFLCVFNVQGTCNI